MSVKPQVLQSINKTAADLFDAIKSSFRRRPLYVMFESKLGCDPRHDHETPKDVYPLFEDAFTALQEAYVCKIQTQILQFQNDLISYYERTMAAEFGTLVDKLNEMCEKERARAIL